MKALWLMLVSLARPQRASKKVQLNLLRRLE